MGAFKLFGFCSLSQSQASSLAATRQKLRTRPRAGDLPGAKPCWIFLSIEILVVGRRHMHGCKRGTLHGVHVNILLAQYCGPHGHGVDVVNPLDSMSMLPSIP